MDELFLGLVHEAVERRDRHRFYIDSVQRHHEQPGIEGGGLQDLSKRYVTYFKKTRGEYFKHANLHRLI